MKTIQRKFVSFMLGFFTIVAVFSTAIASVQLYYEMPMNATLEDQPSLSMYLGNSPWTNGTSVGWGTIGSQASKTLNIKNTGNVGLQVVATLSGLPQNWDLTYDKNGSIAQPGQWLNGTLSLQTSALSEGATYYWQMNILAGTTAT